MSQYRHNKSELIDFFRANQHDLNEALKIRALYKPYTKRNLETISNMPGHTKKDFRRDASKILKNATWRVQSHEFILMLSPNDHIDPNDQNSIRRFRIYCQIFIHNCFDGSFHVSSRYKDKHGKFRYRFRYTFPKEGSASRFYWMLDIQPDSHQNSRVHAHIMVINRDLKKNQAMSANYYGIRHVRKSIHRAAIEFNQLPDIQQHPEYKISDIAQYKKERKPTKNAQAVITGLNRSLSSINVKSIRALEKKLRNKNIEMKYVRPSKKRKHTGFKFRVLTRKVSKNHKIRLSRSRWIWSSRLCRFKGAKSYDMNGIKAILSDHRKEYARRKYQQKHSTSSNNVNQTQSLSSSSEDMNQLIIKPASAMRSSYSAKSMSASSSQVPSEIIIRSQASARLFSIESAKQSYEKSARIAFKDAARSIDNGQRNMNSYLSSKISRIKSRPSNAPEWNTAIKKYRRYRKNVISIKDIEYREARRVKRLMPKFHRDLARQYSYWYYQNAPEILTAQFKGYNQRGIPKFAIDKKDTSWFHKLVHPIIKGFQQNQQWITQKWQSGKHAIRSWMKEHYIPYNVQSRNGNNITDVRNFKLTDIEDYYKQSVFHRVFYPISKRTHSIIKRSDKRIHDCHDEAHSMFNLTPQVTSYKNNVLKSKAFSASSASASYNYSVSEQVKYYTDIKSNIVNINHVNSLRVSAQESVDEDHSANIASLELKSPATKSIIGTDISHVSNAALAANTTDRYLKNNPTIKKYAKKLRIISNKSKFIRKSMNQSRQPSAKANGEFFDKSRRTIRKRRQEHRRTSTAKYRNRSNHNNNGFER